MSLLTNQISSGMYIVYVYVHAHAYVCICIYSCAYSTTCTCDVVLSHAWFCFVRAIEGKEVRCFSIDFFFLGCLKLSTINNHSYIVAVKNSISWHNNYWSTSLMLIKPLNTIKLFSQSDEYLMLAGCRTSLPSFDHSSRSPSLIQWGYRGYGAGSRIWCRIWSMTSHY